MCCLLLRSLKFTNGRRRGQSPGWRRQAEKQASTAGRHKARSGEKSGRSRSGGADRIFDFAVFDLFLTVDAVRSPRESFEALEADLVTAVDTLAKTAFLHTVERLLDQAKLLMAGRALAKEKLLLIRKNCLIGDVLRVVGYGFAALLDGGRHRLLQELLLRKKLLLIVRSEERRVGKE